MVSSLIGERTKLKVSDHKIFNIAQLAQKSVIPIKVVFPAPELPINAVIFPASTTPSIPFSSVSCSFVIDDNTV